MPRRAFHIVSRPPALLIPVLGCLSLLASSVIVAQKKRLWNDEILSLVLLSDPSFTHMLSAWGDTFNQAPPGYFVLGWVWDKLFGPSEISLRVPSSLCMSAGLLLTWRCAQPVWGAIAAGIGVTGVFSLSSLILYHNSEARMYGLFVATCAAGLYCYQRLSEVDRPCAAMLCLNALAQASMVYTHLYGTFYSAALLASLIAIDRVAHARDPACMLLWRPPGCSCSRSFPR